MTQIHISKLRFILSKFIVLSIILASFLFVIGICLLVALFIMGFPRAYQNFCDPEDEVLQVIIDNADVWIDEFTTNESNIFAVHPQFTVDGVDRRFGAIPEYESNNNRIVLFYVSTSPGWPNRPQGVRGYIYSINGQQPVGFWEQEYTISHLSGNVFCYMPK